MKRIGITCALLASLAFPAGAMAQSSADERNGARECRSLLRAMGTENFRTTYGTNKNDRNAFGKCVSSRARDEAREGRTAKSNAAKECKAERDADRVAFDAKYRNLGKCVSSRAKSKEREADAKDREMVNAAKACRAEQKADADKFAATYGTRRNAFGKCVSTKAREKDEEESSTS